jgi:FdhD protein
MKQSGIESEKIIRRRKDGRLEYQADDLTVEEPLEIRLGDRILATTMRTPGHDDELAAGFLVSEGIVHERASLKKLSRIENASNFGNSIAVELSGKSRLQPSPQSRVGTITSSCGICGKTNIAEIRQNFGAINNDADVRIQIETLLSLPALLRQHQSDFARTGGIHAAAVFDLNGRLLIAREDIGRHNAVDKVVGRAFLDGLLPLRRDILLVSGRASFEIVQKALAAGIPLIASVSAASTLAVEFARETNQTLIGFLRPPSFNVYSHIERVILNQAT